MIRARTPPTVDAVADHYDELDPIYRRLWGEDVHHGLWRSGRETPHAATAALSALVGERLGFGAGAHLADIGCGYGATARRFAAAGAVVDGYTLSASQIGHARPVPGVTLHCRDWMDNGLPEASIDGAYAIESSEHFPDKSGFFRETRRVLRSEGRLVVCVWLAAERPTPWQVRHLLEPICSEGRLPSMGSESEYRAMADAAGFETVNFEEVSRLVERTWWICLRRLLAGIVTDTQVLRTVLSARNRVFALSVPRLIVAYRTGAMRYGVFTFQSR